MIGLIKAIGVIIIDCGIWINILVTFPLFLNPVAVNLESLFWTKLLIPFVVVPFFGNADDGENLI